MRDLLRARDRLDEGIENTPSGRVFHHVEPASGTNYVGFQPVHELFA